MSIVNVDVLASMNIIPGSCDHFFLTSTRMKKEFSIYENESGDPYDLIIPFGRRVEEFPRGFKTNAPDPGDPPAGFKTKIRNIFFPRSRGAVLSGLEPSGTSFGRTSTQGQNLSGGPTKSEINSAKTIDDADIPGGRGKQQSDGSVADTKGVKHSAGERGTNELVPTKYTPSHTNEQHTPERQRASREKIIDRITKGTALLPVLLPLSLILAAIIQGAVDCDQLDDKDHEITSADSARYPSYPEGTPEWIKNNISYNKTKVNIHFSPCSQILSNDTITIKSSNVFDGDYGVKNIAPCVIQIDTGSEYVSNTFSNTAYFTLHTSCEDRMMYDLGEDLGDIVNVSSSGLQGLGEGLLDSVPWGTIFYIVMFIIVVWLFFGLVKSFI